ncbi:MAG: hypothetical protein DCC51_15270 [Anaerolineae bacterium]|nr:MAG: hypothetical protein DCC51_15270 [Anaerolineae bacterium]
MKRILLVSLLLIMAFTVVACGGGAAQVEQLAPTLEAAAEQLAPTVQAAVEEVAPTLEAVATNVAPTIDAAAATVAAAATSVAAQPTEAPTEEPTAEPVEEAAGIPMEECDATYEGETIIVHQAAGLTGPLSQILGDGFITGSQAAVDRINAAGGVCGVMLEIRLEDTQYDPEQEVAVYEKFKAHHRRPQRRSLLHPAQRLHLRHRPDLFGPVRWICGLAPGQLG